jgi:hypothetical protein
MKLNNSWIATLAFAFLLAPASTTPARAELRAMPNPFADLRVFPNPWRADNATAFITFDRIPTGSTVKLFTVSGRWVRSVHADSSGAFWDLRNDKGDKVASGVYLFTVTVPGTSDIGRGQVHVIR